MRWALCVAAVGAALAAAPSAFAAEDAPRRPTVCLVLSGGGARGAAHIGVLRTLEELRVPIDCIAGTSMGAIVGGYYAAGMSPDELEQLLAGANWADLFVDRPDRRNRSFRRKSDDRELLAPIRLRLGKEGVALPLGFVQGQKLDRLLKSAELKTTAERDFDRFPIRFRAVAADARTGERVVIAGGGLARGVRASMSVPGLFAPVERDGRLLVDGGITENLPVSVAREMGADILIVVDVSTPLDPDAKVESLFDVLDLTSTIMTARTVEQAKTLLTSRDILIECDPGIPFTDFSRAAGIVGQGAAAARAHAAELSALAAPENEFATYLSRRQRRPTGPVRIDEVRFENTTPIADKVLLAQLGVRPGDPLDPDKVTDGLVHLFGLEYFEPLSFDVEPDADRTRLVVRAPRRRDGLDSLQFGLRFEDDFQGGDEFTITARYDVLALNRLGGEWRSTLRLGDTEQVSTQFYQPLDAAMMWFVAPEIDYRRETVPLISDGQIVAEYNRAGYYGLVSAGRIFGDWGAVTASLARGEFDVDPRIGTRSIPEEQVSRATGSLTFLVDTLDSVTWPRRGLDLLADYSREIPGLGADTRTTRLLLRADKAGHWKRLGAVVGVEWATDLSPEDSREPAIELGGLFRLSGYGPSELVGERGGLFRVFSYYRLTEEKFFFLRPGLYVGLSLEAGAVAARSEALSWSDTLLGAAGLVGADTFFGPVYLGYGWSEPDKDRFFLVLGRPF